MGNYESFITGMLVGAGMALGVLLTDEGAGVNNVKIFREEGRPAIARVYRGLASDGIFVNNLTKTNNFERLNKYLEAYSTDKHDRAIERARIEKVVDW